MAEDKGRKTTDDDVDQDEEDDDVDTDSEDWKPPTKEEWAKLNAGERKWRLRATGRGDEAWKARQGTGGQKDDKPETKPKDDAPDRDAIEREVREKIEAEYATKADEGNLKAAVSVSLAPMLALSEDQTESPAAMRKAVSRVVNMLDLKGMTLEDDGGVDGLDEEVADLRRSYPGLFKTGGTVKAGARTRGADGATKTGTRTRNDDDGLGELARKLFSG